MQGDVHDYHLAAQHRCFERFENTLVWVAVSAMLVGAAALALQHYDGQGLVLILIYIYFWLPIAALVVILNLLACLGHTFRVHTI